MDHPSIKRLWKGAEALREGFAQKGYVTQEEVKKAIPHAPEPYRLYLTTALNNDGIVDRDEYIRLDRISDYYRPLLEDLRQQSPLFREFKVLAEKAKVELQARKRIAANAWRWCDFPNVGEQDAFSDLVVQWINDPKHRGTPLSGDFLRSVFGCWSLNKKVSSKLEKVAMPLIFHENDTVRLLALRFIEPQKAIAAAHQRLTKNPDDLYPFLVLTYHIRMDINGTSESLKKALEKAEALIAQFEERVKKNPSDAKAYWALGHLYASVAWKTYKEGIVEFFDKAARFEPDNPRFQFDKAGGWTLTYDIESSLMYIEEALGGSSVGSLEKAVQLDPENLSYLYQLASVLVHSCKPQASSMIPKVATARPFLYLELGGCYLRSKNFEGAVQAFNAFLELSSNLGVAEWVVGRKYSNNKKYQDTILHYERALSLQPTDLNILSTLGEAYLEVGNLDKAAAYYCKSIDWKDAFEIDNWEDEIEKFEEKQRYDLVAQLYEAGCKKDTKNGRVFFKLGRAYFFADNYPKAIEAFQRATNLEPNNEFYYYFLGDAYSYTNPNQLEKALAAYQRALELLPDARNHHRLGETLKRLGRHKEALPYLEKAIRLNQYVSYNWSLGSCYDELQQYSKAAQVYLQIVRISTDKETKREAWYRAAEAKYKMKDFDGAYFAYEQSLALREGEDRILPRLGLIRVHRAVGAMAQAQQKAEELLKDYPKHVDVCFEYALTQEAEKTRGGWVKARVMLEDKILKKLDPLESEKIKVYEALARILRKLGGEQNIQKADEYTAQAERLKLQISKP